MDANEDARLAKIEAALDGHVILDDVRFAQTQAIIERLDKIDSAIALMDKELSRYRGFIGGILLVVTSIVTFLKLFWDDFIRIIK